MMLFIEQLKVANAKVVIKDIAWYIEKFTPNLDNQQLIADQLLSGNTYRIIL